MRNSAGDSPKHLNGRKGRAAVRVVRAFLVALLFLLLTLRWRIGRRSGILLVSTYGLFVVATVTGLI